MAKDSGKKQAEDLEVSPDKARDVKGGQWVDEPDGGAPRGLLVHTKHKKHKKHKH